MKQDTKKYSRAMTIAASDSGGGAGIQADLKTFSALGCFGTSVIVALTAQNTQEVGAIYPVEPSFIEQQFDMVMSDIGTDAIKIGMLHRKEVIAPIAAKLAELKGVPIVLDPVMISKSGFLLLENNAIDMLKTKLIPHVTLITPNLMEAAELCQQQISNEQDMQTIAISLAKTYGINVLLKGGHMDHSQESADCLYEIDNGRVSWFRHQRIQSSNTHGTGCTLSSAIAAMLARGHELKDAVEFARFYLQSAIRSGAQHQLGHGHGPVDHFAVLMPAT